MYTVNKRQARQVRTERNILRGTNALMQLSKASAPLNIKPAYSLWFAAGLARHLKGQPYVKIQRSIVQA